MKILIVGGDKKFISLLNKISKGSTVLLNSVSEAVEYVRANSVDTIFLLPQYNRGEYFIPEFSDAEHSGISALISEGKTKLYIENYPSYDYRDCYIFGLQARGPVGSINKNSLCLSGKYKDELDFEILQKRTGFCFPNAPHTHEKHEVLIEIKNCLGVHNVVKDDGVRYGVALMKSRDKVFCSMADLTRLSDNEIFPYKSWREFYAKLLSELLGVSECVVREAFSEIYQKPCIAKQSRDKNLDKALKSAVLSALQWHTDSGIMIDVGKGGVYEMIRSFDLGIAKNVRGDSSLFTAALFMASGKYFGRADYTEIAENIAKNILDERALQITEEKNRGLFKWFADSSGLGPRSVYVSDTSRVGNSLLALYRLSKNEDYLHRIVMLGDALLRWFGGDALLPVCSLNYETDDLQSVQEKKRRLSAEFYDAPLIFLGNLYDVTGDERYLQQVLKTAERLARAYPNYDTITSHSDNFTYGRLLGALVVAQRYQSGVWTSVIDELLVYFKRLQHPSGGFFDGRAYVEKNSLESDVEFAVGIGGDCHIADIVYCQNTLLYSLNILLSAKGDFDRALAEQMYGELEKFLLDTQIVSYDKRLSGAWMRAFDMDNMEYYGCDKDFAWGPYCILTGWVTGAIPLVFLERLGVKTMY